MNSKSNRYSTITSPRVLVFWNGFPTKVSSGIVYYCLIFLLVLELILRYGDWVSYRLMLLNRIFWSHLDVNCYIIMVVYNMSHFHSLVGSLLGPFCPQMVVSEGRSLPGVCGNTLAHMARVSFRHIWPLIGNEAEVGGRTCLNGQQEKCWFAWEAMM